MRLNLLLFLFAFVMFSCRQSEEISSIDPEDWGKRTIQNLKLDSLISGKTYLSVYSQIYSLTAHKQHNLTATISMRNTNEADTIYIEKAKYYDTDGVLIRNYFEGFIYIRPLETVEIVIDEYDKAGGTGANFIFDWKVKKGVEEPFFEAVMISTNGQQGLSFTTQGQRTKKTNTNE